MPTFKSQEEKAQSSINAQPKRESSIIHQILERDVAGWSQGDIAKDLGYTSSRICIIQGSPIYTGLKKDRLAQLKSAVTEKVSDHIADADSIIKKARGEAAETLVNIMRNGRSEAVRAKVAGDIVGIGKEDKGQTIIVQINEKLGDRMTKVLNYKE